MRIFMCQICSQLEAFTKAELETRIREGVAQLGRDFGPARQGLLVFIIYLFFVYLIVGVVLAQANALNFINSSN